MWSVPYFDMDVWLSLRDALRGMGVLGIGFNIGIMSEQRGGSVVGGGVGGAVGGTNEEQQQREQSK